MSGYSPFLRGLLWATLIGASTCESGTLVYRCADPDGTIAFGDTPCSAGTEQIIDLSSAPAPGTRLVNPGIYDRPGEKPSSRQRPSRTSSRSSDPDRAWCENRRRRLERLQDELRAGYSPSRGEKLRRKRRQLENEIRDRCR